LKTSRLISLSPLLFVGGTTARLKLYASSSYNIGGLIFSLNEIENGLLRGNRKSAVPLTFVPFRRRDDPKRKLQLLCDPRIHFALNCGAISCPPIAVYSSEPDELNNQLALATEGFLDASVSFEPSSRSIVLSMLFKWYRQDFGESDEEIIDWIKRNGTVKLRERFAAFEESIGGRKGIKLKYSEYNWNLNEL
jgi:hypothetical protein